MRLTPTRADKNEKVKNVNLSTAVHALNLGTQSGEVLRIRFRGADPRHQGEGHGQHRHPVSVVKRHERSHGEKYGCCGTEIWKDQAW